MVFTAQPRSLSPSKFTTAEEHASLIDEVNRRKQRAKRAGQLPPLPRKQPRSEPVSFDDECEAEGFAADRGDAANTQSTEWALRQQLEQQRWKDSRLQNQQKAQQHEAYDALHISQLRVDTALHCATQSIARALARHSCCIATLQQGDDTLQCQLASQLLSAAQHEPDAQQAQQQGQQQGQQQQGQEQQGQEPQGQQQQGQQQQGQQQQQQQGMPAAPLLTIVSMRAVACHVAGASFWLPVPRVSCTCCGNNWEVQAAEAGFFGCSPVVPGVWFDTQVLDAYTCLYGFGVSATAYAECLSKTAARVEGYNPPMPRTVASLRVVDDRWVGCFLQGHVAVSVL